MHGELKKHLKVRHLPKGANRATTACSSRLTKHVHHILQRHWRYFFIRNQFKWTVSQDCMDLELIWRSQSTCSRGGGRNALQNDQTCHRLCRLCVASAGLTNNIVKLVCRVWHISYCFSTLTQFSVVNYLLPYHWPLCLGPGLQTRSSWGVTSSLDVLIPRFLLPGHSLFQCMFLMLPSSQSQRDAGDWNPLLLLCEKGDICCQICQSELPTHFN